MSNYEPGQLVRLVFPDEPVNGNPQSNVIIVLKDMVFNIGGGWVWSVKLHNVDDVIELNKVYNVTNEKPYDFVEELMSEVFFKEISVVEELLLMTDED